MYTHHFHYGQPASLPPPPQRLIHALHHPHSLPPPSTFHLPTYHLLQAQQHYHYPHHRHYTNAQAQLYHRGYATRRQLPQHVTTQRTASDTTTLTTGSNDSKRHAINKTDTTKTNVLKEISEAKNSITSILKSTADWTAKIFCFCFTDKDVEYKDTLELKQ